MNPEYCKQHNLQYCVVCCGSTGSSGGGVSSYNNNPPVKNKRGSDGFSMKDKELKSISDEKKVKRRNDLADLAMLAIIKKAPFTTKADDGNNDVINSIANGAYAYADAMLAASGDYDES